jgi:MoaA/NifB/PqqE/SkfB family radical SAM enzyme
MSTLFETARVLHIEPTDVCQAACPSCARETDVNFNKNIHTSLSLADVQRLLPERLIYRLDKMFMCGNYGDPAANTEVPAIFSHFRQINSSIVLGMNTNGGLQNQLWWRDLAGILYEPTDYVVFSIDGLEDTNHLYRRGVSWARVMQNVATFIRAGGNAQWDMLVYEHNEHQVDACEQLARDMGFRWFRAKVSRRKSTVEWLRPPRAWSTPQVKTGAIDCFRDREQSIYFSARGVWHPCCWLGYTKTTVNDFDQVRDSWNTTTCNPVCQETCSTVDSVSRYTAQWQREVELC